MRLLTNNPVKRVGLEAYGLEIVENVPVETTPNQYNERYLRTKKERMGHTLHLVSNCLLFYYIKENRLFCNRICITTIK